MATHPLIAAALAMPNTHEVVSTYADGSERRLTTRNLLSAKNHARRESAKIGRGLIDRDTGKTVRYVSVDVRELVSA